MMSPKVFQDLQSWVKKGIRILLVGDGYQLPPVMSRQEEEEHGEDFSVFGKVEGPVLTEIMRSDDEIIRVATELRTTFRVPRRLSIRWPSSRKRIPAASIWRSKSRDGRSHICRIATGISTIDRFPLHVWSPV